LLQIRPTKYTQFNILIYKSLTRFEPHRPITRQ